MARKAPWVRCGASGIDFTDTFYREARVPVQKQTGTARLGRLQMLMSVIGHLAKRKHSPAVSVDRLPQAIDEILPILVVIEDILSIIAPKIDVIDRIRVL